MSARRLRTIAPVRRSRIHECGLTLAEMLVALTVSLAVVLGAGRLLALAGEAYAAQTEASAIDDGGRYALELIARAVRQAAWFDPAQAGGDPAVLPAHLAGLDACSLAKTTFGIDTPQPDAGNGSDVLAVRFPGAGAAPGGDGSVLDCAGFAHPEGEEGWSIFYVARNADGEAELRCKYRGTSNWGADALVSGVDGFQVLYGVDTDEPRDHVANRYLNAAAIAGLDAALGLGADVEALHRQTYWKRVVSVRIGLLLHGARPTRREGGALGYALLGSGYAPSGAVDADPGSVLHEADMPAMLRARERRLFTATVVVPAAMP
ncbi:PilW family protein [Herbaspirillum sp. SJZ107]|uniref:PilW family protein n=1 Tax=Herbaspirillum sp. SJZ107 TaxID=2572881 RepID=UPI00117475B4|nr:PilW family protein [Herbaspirillum sp. SJZ107]TQK10679.1 type IV pilus assembly protein PilW [Herbaspirillum sp. SJZ107]